MRAQIANLVFSSLITVLQASPEYSLSRNFHFASNFLLLAILELNLPFSAALIGVELDVMVFKG